jgi:peptidoglycan/xylan/chitin deacetylase (PgdA/CDA1 family)
MRNQAPQPEQFRFVVQIGARQADGSFPLRAFVRRGAGGRVAVGAAEERLLLPERLVAQARRLLEPYERQPVGDEAELGVFLARQILPRPVRTLLLEAVGLAREHDAALHFELAVDPPELATLPWEWLTVTGKSRWSPALLEDYGLTRLSGRRAPRPYGNARAGQHGSGVLLVAPDANDATLRAIRAALRTGTGPTLPLEVLIAPSNSQLRATLRRRRPRVLHLLARAEFDAPDAPLLFLDAPLGAAELAALASPQAPPLFVLDGGWHAEGMLAAAGPRMAYALVEAGANAAVAFHSALYPDESALFARALYEALASEAPAHQALALARQALFEGGAAAAWGLPMIVRCQEAAAPRQAGLATGRLGELPLPTRLRKLAVPLAAGGAGLLVAAGVLLGQPRAASETAAPHPPLGASGAATNDAFAISLPTPTFAPPVDTPSIAESQPTRQPPPTPPAPPREPLRWATYHVQPGDSVEGIAATMGSDAAALAALNRVDVAAQLIPGRALMVPVYSEGAAGASAGGLDVNIGRQDEPVVALTVDTEINDVMLYQILDILNARGLRATFFVTGGWVRSYPDAARAIIASGSELGNHSLTHPAFTQIGLDGAVNELVETERIVRETTGVTTRPFFRFPYGDKNPQVLGLLAEQGYISYHWSADDNAISRWLANVAANPRGGYGGILLMHQRADSIAALPGWLDQLQQMGFRVVPLSEILK